MPGHSILVLSHLYPSAAEPVFGSFVHTQVKCLLARGHSVRVCTGVPFWINAEDKKTIQRASAAAAKDAFTGWETYDGVKVARFPWKVGTAFPPDVHGTTYAEGFLAALPFLYQDFQFELIHAHTALHDGFAAASSGRPYILTEHTGPFTQITNSAGRRKCTLEGVRRARRILTVSRALATSIREALPEVNITADIVGNVVDIDRFHTDRHLDAQLIRSRNAIEMLAHPEDEWPWHVDCKALWVGGFTAVKQPHMLIGAFAKALKSFPRLSLTLVGAGELRAEIEDLIKAHALESVVTLVGAVDRDAVATLFHQHDFVVVSSAVETFSMVCAEALASGKPVVSTACGGPEDIIQSPDLGMIVPNTVDGLADGLVSMGRRFMTFEPVKLRQSVVARYSPEAIAGEISAIYDEEIDQIAKSSGDEPPPRIPLVPRRRLVWFGTFHRSRPSELVLAAFSRARQLVRPLTLFMLGEGPAVTDVRDRVATEGWAGCVFLREAPSDEDVNFALGVGDLVVITDQTELSRRFADRAVGLGVPVVCVGGASMGGSKHMLAVAEAVEVLADALVNAIHLNDVYFGFSGTPSTNYQAGA